MELMFQPLRRYADFQGRARRAEYWLFQLGLCLFLLAITLAVMARAAPQLNVYSVGFSLQVMVVLLGGLFLLPEFVRTLHAIIARTGQTIPFMLSG